MEDPQNKAKSAINLFKLPKTDNKAASSFVDKKGSKMSGLLKFKKAAKGVQQRISVLRLVKKSLKKESEDEEEEETLMSKIIEIMCYPVEILLMTTCFPAEKEEFEPAICQISVIGGTVFMFWVFN